MTLYLVHTTSTYDGSERRSSTASGISLEELLSNAASRGSEVLSIYAWTGPVEAACTLCGQELELFDGEWVNPHGFPSCPEVRSYPFRHVPAGIQAVPWSGILPDWMEAS
jgi:hypothetical protein